MYINLLQDRADRLLFSLTQIFQFTLVRRVTTPTMCYQNVLQMYKTILCVSWGASTTNLRASNILLFQKC